MNDFKQNLEDIFEILYQQDKLKLAGFIQEIYSEKRGINRKFIFAKVIKTDGSYEPFNLSYLTKESVIN